MDYKEQAEMILNALEGRIPMDYREVGCRTGAENVVIDALKDIGKEKMRLISESYLWWITDESDPSCQRMNRFYFTFGSDERFPFQGGWVEILAATMSGAVKVFDAYFPNRFGNTSLYTARFDEEVFLGTGFPDKGVSGAYCHMKIGPFLEMEANL